jgi:hypothetical protein
MESTISLFKTELIDRQRSWTGRNEVWTAPASPETQGCETPTVCWAGC